MNEKTKGILKDARNKVEDAIVKAKNFIEKHPIACTIGGTAISAVVAGAIGKKVGFKDGYNAMYKETEEWVYNDQPVNDLRMIADEGSKFVTDDIVRRNLVRGACGMHLEEGDGVAVVRTAKGLLFDTTLNTETDYMDAVASKFDNPDIPMIKTTK